MNDLIAERLRELVSMRHPEEAEKFMRWIERAVEGDDTDRGILTALIEGTFEPSGWRGDDLLFRLTPAGHERTTALLESRADLRAFFNSLGGNFHVPPKGKPS